MPKYDLKTIQKELDQDRIWPVYWVYGPESYKTREFLRRIRKQVLGKVPPAQQSWHEEIFDASSTHTARIVDSAQSLVFGGGTRLIIVRGSEVLKEPELLFKISGQPRPLGEMTSVCVCLAKDLDGRKKFSKHIVENAAVVTCDEVSESQRETWIRYLAQAKKVELPTHLLKQLLHMEPWSLDLIQQELEKFSLSSDEDSIGYPGELEILGGTDVFLEHFFKRNVPGALRFVQTFAGQTDQTLILLGLLGWNVRQIASLAYDQEKGTQTTNLSSFHVDRLKRWSSNWKLSEVLQLQVTISEMDYRLKQTPLMPLGLWSELIIHCVKRA